MKITEAWLMEKGACSEGVVWFKNQQETNALKLVGQLISIGDDQKLSWANWFIVRYMNYKQRVKYAIFAAEQVIDLYEKKCPKDDRPRKAIETAKKYLKSPTKKNKTAAQDAAYAAYAAAQDAAYTAQDAAYAAYAAAYAAYAATDAAAQDAAYAANAAYTANVAMKKEMKIKILKYGMSLLVRGKQ